MVTVNLGLTVHCTFFHSAEMADTRLHVRGLLDSDCVGCEQLVFDGNNQRPRGLAAAADQLGSSDIDDYCHCSLPDIELDCCKSSRWAHIDAVGVPMVNSLPNYRRMIDRSGQSTAMKPTY